MTERIVRKVEATRQMHTMAPLRTLTRRKAACYLRISTRSDEQENSLENQRAHYEELFATSPDYEFAGCYYDDGVSGTGISHRHGFQQIYSIPLTLISFTIGMVIAILSALLIINKVPLLSQLMRFYVWVFRGTPLLVQLFIVYWGICNPMKISNLVACVIALSLNVGAS